MLAVQWAVSCFGETVAAGVGQTKSVELADNETVFFRTVVTPDRFSLEHGILGNFRVVMNGMTNFFSFGSVGYFGRGTYAITGPALLSFSNSIVTFDRVKNTGIKSVIISGQENQAKQFQVGSEQSLMIFEQFNADGLVLLFSFPGIEKKDCHFPGAGYPNLRFDGPFSVEMSAETNTIYGSPIIARQQLVSYAIVDQARPTDGLVSTSASTGQTELRVEKSADLKTWSPALLYPVPGGDASFYRLRMQK